MVGNSCFIAILGGKTRRSLRTWPLQVVENAHLLYPALLPYWRTGILGIRHCFPKWRFKARERFYKLRATAVRDSWTQRRPLQIPRQLFFMVVLLDRVCQLLFGLKVLIYRSLVDRSFACNLSYADCCGWIILFQVKETECISTWYIVNYDQFAL